MSRTDRHLPYQVAYRRITGKDPETVTKETLTVDKMLANARNGDHHHFDVSYRDQYYYGITPTMVLAPMNWRWSVLDSTTSRTISSRFIRSVGVVSLTHHGDSPDLLVTDENSHELMSYLLDYSYEADDHVPVYPRQQVVDCHLQPIEFEDSEDVMFVTVKELQSGYAFDHSVCTYRVVFWVSSPEVEVITTVSEPMAGFIRAGEVLSGADAHALSRMVDQSYMSSEINATIVEKSNSSRRAAERDHLREITKMINGGANPLDMDTHDYDAAAIYSSWKGY